MNPEDCIPGKPAKDKWRNPMKKSAHAIIFPVLLTLVFSGCSAGKPSPVPDNVREHFSNLTEIDTDTFENDGGKWQITAPGGIQDGVLNLIGNEWYSDIYKKPVTDGQGIIIEFSYSQGSIFELLFTSGEWGTDQHKRFGIYIDNNLIRPNFPPANVGTEGINGGLSLKPDTTYSIMLAIIQGGEFYTVIWDPSNPQKVLTHHRVVGNTWGGFQWTFSVGGKAGTILFDNFKAVAFDGLISGWE
jgi:hypothetical protein